MRDVNEHDGGTPGPHGPTILVVEDHADTRRALSQVLSLEGYHVVAVEDGQDALAYLDRGPTPDLVLLDLMLPCLDGREFLMELYRRECGVPVVVQTAAPVNAAWARAHGCAGFLSKPIDLGDLLGAVRRCAGPGAA